MKHLVTVISYPFTELIKLYQYGFSVMSRESRMLWIIATIKLVILFGILKLFFFKDFLKTNFPTEKARTEYLQEQFTTINK